MTPYKLQQELTFGLDGIGPHIGLRRHVAFNRECGFESYGDRLRVQIVEHPNQT